MSRHVFRLRVPMNDILLDMVRKRSDLGSPFGKAGCPQWGRPERVPRSNRRCPTIQRSTLSVSLFG